MVISCSENAWTAAVIGMVAFAKANLAGQQAAAAVWQVPRHVTLMRWSDEHATRQGR
jgi:hypothetical protein